jgi:hypothetical protein
VFKFMKILNKKTDNVRMTYYVIFWCVRVILLPLKGHMCHIFWVGVCSFSYPTCNAPYCIVVCGLSGSTVFSHIILKRLDFRKKGCWALKEFWFYFFYNFSTIFLQFFYNFSTIFLQFFYKFSTIFLQFLSETYLILIIIERNVVTSVLTSSSTLLLTRLRF